MLKLLAGAFYKLAQKHENNERFYNNRVLVGRENIQSSFFDFSTIFLHRLSFDQKMGTGLALVILKTPGMMTVGDSENVATERRRNWQFIAKNRIIL